MKVVIYFNFKFIFLYFFLNFNLNYLSETINNYNNNILYILNNKFLQIFLI